MTPRRRKGSRNVSSHSAPTGTRVRAHGGADGLRRRRAQCDRRTLPRGRRDVAAAVGWVEFCAEHSRECDVQDQEPRDVVLNPKVWSSLVRINDWVNQAIRPITDVEHWGTIEKWSYPDDGYGDCEDYVLLKRRMLIEAGWPRSALLITVVRDRKGRRSRRPDGPHRQGRIHSRQPERQDPALGRHGYRFVKRQSQTDPNTWVALGDRARPPQPPARAVAPA